MSLDNVNKLLKLSEYMDHPCIVFPQGHIEIQYKSMQEFINDILEDTVYEKIYDFHTYVVSFVGIQENLLNEKDSIVMIYLV